MTQSGSELQKIPSEHGDYLGMIPHTFLHLLKFTEEKKNQFLLGNVSAKNLKLGFHSHTSEKREEKERKKKTTQTDCCFLCSYCKYFMNGYLRAKHPDKNSL